MSLAQELRDQIRACVESAAPLGHLRDWLSGHVPAIYDRDEPDAEELASNLWVLFSELDSGDRSEMEVRHELALAIRPIRDETGWATGSRRTPISVTLGTPTGSISPAAARPWGRRLAALTQTPAVGQAEQSAPA
jgi:hypothetical protein